MKFYFINEAADYKYVHVPRGWTNIPPIGSIITFTRSDNDQIPAGDFKVTGIEFDLHIVNQFSSADNSGSALIILERVK